MNNFEKPFQLNKEDSRSNDMDEQNSGVSSHEILDSEYSYESHYTPYEDLFSDSNFDF